MEAGVAEAVRAADDEERGGVNGGEGRQDCTAVLALSPRWGVEWRMELSPCSPGGPPPTTAGVPTSSRA